MRTPIVAALACMLSACVARPSPDTFSVHNYISRKTTEQRIQTGYAALYPHSLAPVTHNAVRVINPSVAQSALNRTINIEWNGTLDDLVRNLARRTGYLTRAIGERSGAPITVSVNWRRITIIGALREAFKDGKGLARLEIDQRRRLMTVRYARPERSPVPHLDDSQL